MVDAAVQAGEVRLRPIIMTSLAFIFGAFPLVIATGAGANARHSIGTGITGGMISEAGFSRAVLKGDGGYRMADDP